MKPSQLAPLDPADADYLLTNVRGFEPDWLLALPYLNTENRAGHLAILAFAAEVMGTPGRVSQPMLGQIRLQWWREAIAEIFGDAAPRRHPVVTALTITCRDHQAAGLISDLLLLMIDGMEPFLEEGEDHSIEEAISLRRSAYGSLSRALYVMNTTNRETSSGTNDQELENSLEVLDKRFTEDLSHLVAAAHPSLTLQLSDGLLLHALAKSIFCEAVPLPEAGHELPSSRFARSSCNNSDLHSDLAQTIAAWRTSTRTWAKASSEDETEAFLAASLPLALIRPSQEQIRCVKHPWLQRWVLFRAVLRGAP
ncbi:MAG: squalene/phytoene synthase family protein [Pseudomonadota bacterium]